jgi:hypothetical protein
LLKRILPAKLLAALDGLFQPTGALWQFHAQRVRARKVNDVSKSIEIPLNVLTCSNAPSAEAGIYRKKRTICSARLAMPAGGQ